MDSLGNSCCYILHNGISPMAAHVCLYITWLTAFDVSTDGPLDMVLFGLG